MQINERNFQESRGSTYRNLILVIFLFLVFCVPFLKAILSCFVKLITNDNVNTPTLNFKYCWPFCLFTVNKRGVPITMGQLLSTPPINNRDLQILRPGQDFLNTNQCACVNQRHCGEKTRQPSPFYCGFQRKCHNDGNKLSNVRSFIILLSVGGSSSFNESNR